MSCSIKQMTAGYHQHIFKVRLPCESFCCKGNTAQYHIPGVALSISQIKPHGISIESYSIYVCDKYMYENCQYEGNHDTLAHCVAEGVVMKDIINDNMNVTQPPTNFVKCYNVPRVV